MNDHPYARFRMIDACKAIIVVLALAIGTVWLPTQAAEAYTMTDTPQTDDTSPPQATFGDWGFNDLYRLGGSEALTITKQLKTAGPFDPGDTVEFEILIEAKDGLTYTNVSLDDPLVPDCSNPSVGTVRDIDGGSHTENCSTIAGQFGFTNVATATGMISGTVVTVTDSVSFEVSEQSIEITKSPAVQAVTTDGTANFTITVKNTGTAAITNVVVTDASAPNCSQALGDDLVAGESVDLPCSFSPVTDGFINTAEVTASVVAAPSVMVYDKASANVQLQSNIAICPADAQAYWKLNEEASGLYDEFIGGHDGTCVSGNCPAPNASGLISGDGAQDFDGADDSLRFPVVPGVETFNWGKDQSFSISLWMKGDASTCTIQNEVMIGRRATGGINWWLGCVDDIGVVGHPHFKLSGPGGNVDLDGTFPINDSDWHHLVGVRDATSDIVRFYVDGKEVASQSEDFDHVDGFAHPDADVTLGWHDTNSKFYYDGLLDEVITFDRALSASDVAQYYQEGLINHGICETSNYPPVIYSDPETMAQGNNAYTYDVNAIGDPTVTYSLTSSPAGMTIDANSGIISWLPSVSQSGPNAVTVQASNGINPADTQSFTINVAQGLICLPTTIAYLPLEESSSPFLDVFADHDGTCTNCPTQVDGQVDKAQSFDGTDDSVSIDADTDFDWGQSDSFSIEAWVKTSDCSTRNRVIVGRDDDSTADATKLHWWLGCSQNTGKAAFALNDEDVDTEGTFLESTNAINDGNWHHLVAVRDGTNNFNRLYVDGVEAAATPVTYNAGFAAPTSKINIGWLNLTSGFRFNGQIDEVALYSAALSPNEVLAHYLAGSLEGEGYCLDPSIAIAKTPDSQLGVINTSVNFAIVVTNTGNITLSNISVSDPLAPNCDHSVGELGPDESSTPHNCSSAPLTADFTNVATVTGQLPVQAGGATINSSDEAMVEMINPSIELSKSPDSPTVDAGGTVTFTLVATNTGDSDLTGIDIADNQCTTSPTRVSSSGNEDQTLNPDEVWTYECAVTNVQNDFTNTAMITGTTLVGSKVSDDASASVTIQKEGPGITIVKGPALQTINVGDSANFTITVRNAGDVDLNTVVVNDPLCGPVTGPTDDMGGDSVLSVGEDWTYTCVANNVLATFTNVASVTANSNLGPTSAGPATASVLVGSSQSSIYLPILLK